MELRDDLRAAALGAGSGVIATSAMSVLMVGAREAGLMSELPPLEMAEKSVERTPAADDVDRDDRRKLGWLGHFGFGAATGLAYALLRNRFRTPGGPVLHGSLFALGVWAVSYLGWVPAMRFLPSATEDEPGRPPTMIAAHLLFGGLLGVLVEGRLPRR